MRANCLNQSFQTTEQLVSFSQQVPLDSARPTPCALSGGICFKGIGMEATKRCTKCKEVKPLSEFYKNGNHKDGHNYECISCRKQYVKQYLEENGELLNAQARQRRKEYPEENKEECRKWRENNLEKSRESRRRYYRKHPETNIVSDNNRRARLIGNGGKITKKEWNELKKHYNYTCLCCGRQEPEIKLTLDHVMPLAQGGINIIYNAQPLCKSCNSSKGTKIIDYR